VGEIFLTGEEAYERAPLSGNVVADGATEHWVLLFQRIENGINGYDSSHFETHFRADSCKVAKMGG